MRMLSFVAVFWWPFMWFGCGGPSAPKPCDRSLESCAKERLASVNVASLYEKVTERSVRSKDDLVNLLKETGTDFVFRGFWRWSPCPNRCDQIDIQEAREKCDSLGYSYAYLEEVISSIKAEMPEIIFTGAIPAQIIHKDHLWNPKTEEVFNYPKTWEMATDPTKWELGISKEKFHCEFGKTHLWVPEDFDCTLYDPTKVGAYFPDITNTDFQALLLSWAERQIDAGADGIWIDMLFTQAGLFTKLGKDFNHPAVRDSFEAASRIVDRIHEYGSQIGRYVYVGSWGSSAQYPYPPPNLDFVTMTPAGEEIRKQTLSQEKWTEGIQTIRSKFPDLPILAFIDWASTTETPLGVFSQELSHEQQEQFLQTADAFFGQNGLNFVYPIRCGWMGDGAKILSFGQSLVYDSLAPEFQTYDRITELARNKMTAGGSAE